MIDDKATITRAVQIRQSLIRHRIVFVQLGYAFHPLKDTILREVGGTICDVNGFMRLPVPAQTTVIVIRDVESMLIRPDHSLPSMGAVREQVMRLVDAGANVCLVSSAPKLAFPIVPGSSLLEDAAPVVLPLLNSDEFSSEGPAEPAALPVMDGKAASALPAVLGSILDELGADVLAALDHALFEIDPSSSRGVGLLEARQAEALRSAGLVYLKDGDYQLTLPK